MKLWKAKVYVPTTPCGEMQFSVVVNLSTTIPCSYMIPHISRTIKYTVLKMFPHYTVAGVEPVIINVFNPDPSRKGDRIVIVFQNSDIHLHLKD
jgi:hypothetical protein